jgi:hypothetical protein
MRASPHFLFGPIDAPKVLQKHMHKEILLTTQLIQRSELRDFSGYCRIDFVVSWQLRGSFGCMALPKVYLQEGGRETGRSIPKQPHLHSGNLMSMQSGAVRDTFTYINRQSSSVKPAEALEETAYIDEPTSLHAD